MEIDKKVMRDFDAKRFFLYLLTAITFYAVLTSFTNLLLDYVDYLFPDNASVPGWLYNFDLANVRWYIAMLIVAYPVYGYLFFYLTKHYHQDTERSRTPMRKFTTYLTVFLAALIVLSDIIAVLYSFLNGGLTSRFLIKAVIIFIIFAWVFYFYMRDIKDHWHSFQLSLNVIFVSLFVLAALIYGFMISGSPFKAREQKLDQQRLSDLAAIQNKVIDYWQRTQKLPSNLAALQDAISGFTPPLDPQTRQSYQYKVLSDLSFELCADFNLPSDKMGRKYTSFSGWNWEHKQGESCFVRTINPKIYKPAVK